MAKLASEAGLPDGVFNVVTGGGRAVGTPMVRRRRLALDHAPDLGRTREADLVDQGVLHHRRADRAPAAGHDVEHAVRQTGFTGQLGHPQGGQRGLPMVLPQASAGATFHVAMSIGKFHGVIMPQTPTGSRKVMPIELPGRGTTPPSILVTQPAK
jgi:hypothetical protein